MLFFYLLLAIAAQKVDPGTTSSVSATTVYYTTTRDGAVLTLPSIYSQQFAELHGSVPTAKLGSIGIGLLTGSVGGIRSYEMVSVNGGGRMGMGGLGVVIMMLL